MDLRCEGVREEVLYRDGPCLKMLVLKFGVFVPSSQDPTKPNKETFKMMVLTF